MHRSNTDSFCCEGDQTQGPCLSSLQSSELADELKLDGLINVGFNCLSVPV